MTEFGSFEMTIAIELENNLPLFLTGFQCVDTMNIGDPNSCIVQVQQNTSGNYSVQIRYNRANIIEEIESLWNG
jgi:hypothetical protein